jgi:hypothetical protein
MIMIIVLINIINYSSLKGKAVTSNAHNLIDYAGLYVQTWADAANT